mgnify:CR=1 FL=1
MMSFINPELAAHNIATAFCERQIQKLPDNAFIPGDKKHSDPAIKEIWELYSNVYDSVFEAADHENALPTDEE